MPKLVKVRIIRTFPRLIGSVTRQACSCLVASSGGGSLTLATALRHTVMMVKKGRNRMVTSRESIDAIPRRVVSGEEFLRRMSTGDPGLWDDLMPMLRRLALGACRDLGVFDHLKDDILQDVALRVFTRWQSYESQSSLATWIYAIARNRCLDELRKRVVRGEVNGLNAPAASDDGEGPVEPALHQEVSLEHTLCVQQVLAELDAQAPARNGGHRMIDVLVYWVENSPSTEELAQFLQTSLGAAKERKSYIVKRIKELCLKFCGHDECAVVTAE